MNALHKLNIIIKSHDKTGYGLIMIWLIRWIMENELCSSWSKSSFWMLPSENGPNGWKRWTEKIYRHPTHFAFGQVNRTSFSSFVHVCGHWRRHCHGRRVAIMALISIRHGPHLKVTFGSLFESVAHLHVTTFRCLPQIHSNE